ncbi:hypothetical protein CPC08DRAFT_713208 [Agrocybe pediades]|nr:hypothetical protein CPC08DRAFT_713208 [Agrocybe pediades]
MSSSPIEFTPNPNLPSNEDIIALCTNLKFPHGTTIVDPSTSSVIAWVKCGPTVTLGEAYTQQWTATALREAGVSDVRVPSVFRAFTADRRGYPIGYIVMEYIEGTDCNSNDADLVARAVKALMSLKPPPTETLGRFGCDASSIVHSFFLDWYPGAGYRSDQDFYDHIRNILKYLHIDCAVDLSKYERFLCLSDFNPKNFKKTTTPDGQSVVVMTNFWAICFMPLPFLEVALMNDLINFRRLEIKLEEKGGYPRGEPVVAEALLRASYQLVPYGSKPLALPRGVSRICSWAIR